MNDFTLEEMLAFSPKAAKAYRQEHPGRWKAWRRAVSRLAQERYVEANQELLNEKSRARVAEWVKRPGRLNIKSAAQRARRAMRLPKTAQNAPQTATEAILAHPDKPLKDAEPLVFRGSKVVRVIRVGNKPLPASIKSAVPTCFTCETNLPLAGKNICKTCLRDFLKAKTA